MAISIRLGQCADSRRGVTRYRSGKRRRRGVIIVLTALLLIGMMAILAFSIDIGYMQNARVEMDRAVDAGALAGAGMLVEGDAEAANEARIFAQQNPVAGRPLENNELQIQVGAWDRDSRTFTPSTTLPYAISVRAERPNVRPMFFGRVLGRDSFSVASEAVAVYQPRDIVLVLDYSGSMNDDSEFRNIGSIGQDEVEANLLQIYQELGAPTFGTLPFAPEWLTVTGNAPQNSSQPQIQVEYRFHTVRVTSTKPFSRVRVYRGSSFQNYFGQGTLDASSGLYEQVLTFNGSSQITRVDVRSGFNDLPHTSSNQYNETILFDTASRIRAHARASFGLDGVSYPYPQGSWNDFIDYCRSSSSNRDAGYYYQFGLLNLVNYWLERQPAAHQTPDLWKTSEQPITAVKNAVSVFIAFMQEKETDDRVALSVYNSPSGDALLERQLAQDFDQLESISRHRQAGHYDPFTNIGAGLREAWMELDQNARAGAFKMIVLMTDGIANRPSSDPVGYVLEQVAECQNRKYPVITISLGANADTALMQQVADMTGGIHFNVPGGQTVAQYEAALKDTFRKIAEKRPLQLVH
jgi:uncharacterized protein YegL